MLKIVINTTPLIVLGNIGHLTVLRKLYGSVYIPQAVFDEVTAKKDIAGRLIHENTDWIIVKAIKDISRREAYSPKLHIGEVEAMILAREIAADIIVLYLVPLRFLNLSGTCMRLIAV